MDTACLDPQNMPMRSPQESAFFHRLRALSPDRAEKALDTLRGDIKNGEIDAIDKHSFGLVQTSCRHPLVGMCTLDPLLAPSRRGRDPGGQTLSFVNFYDI
ncbi:unnamed protein product [Protopolystoma xenopodis]|uniref:Uncharacterized protein n=1 Tax=Protopolystoma xenopodis TaxID=117903 RepID=A0A3S5B0H7_9PLAT|nr:unnamed protein product [Protopolystoma xenopodis]